MLQACPAICCANLVYAGFRALAIGTSLHFLESKYTYVSGCRLGTPAKCRSDDITCIERDVRLRLSTMDNDERDVASDKWP